MKKSLFFGEYDLLHLVVESIVPTKRSRQIFATYHSG